MHTLTISYGSVQLKKLFFSFLKNIKFYHQNFIKIDFTTETTTEKKQKVEAISFPFCCSFVIKYCENNSHWHSKKNFDYWNCRTS